MGLVSLIWFLVRVIPKPSRATYPCQRFAAPIASGFVIWLTGLLGSALAYRRAKQYLRQSRWAIAALFIVVGIAAIWLPLSTTTTNPAKAAFTPSEPANSPIGAAKGIYPGRVVWVHDADAANWDSKAGRWWDDNNTDQNAVDVMVSKAIQTLTGQTSDHAAWNALFKHFNRTSGFGETGYQAGEKIVIKINMNQDSGSTWGAAQGMPSPHVIYSFLKQLINVVGVPGSAITIYDASRYIGDPIYNKIRSNPDVNFQSITFVANTTRNGRLAATYDTANPLRTKTETAYLPRCVTGAKYLINMALLRPHTLYGVTLCAKNHFGSVYFPSRNTFTPEPLHNFGGRSQAMNNYNCLVNLNGHRQLSGKTLLYFIDGLYPAVHQSGNVIKWLSFGDDWASSMLASQDPIAIDSVALDFLRNEPRCTEVTGNPENYLHEAAQADNPPSGTFYDPEGDGTQLSSLGVHEHWNNAVEKKYSRNLGAGNGIELVIPSFSTADGRIQNAMSGLRYDQIRHAISEANAGDKIIIDRGIYYENVNFGGKNLTLSSANPDDPAVVAATVLAGGAIGGPVVTFAGGEDANCVLAGVSVTGTESGLFCSSASPTITNCRIENNAGNGIELREGSSPALMRCDIVSNMGNGISMQAKQGGRVVLYNYPVLTNCVVAGNRGHGVSGDLPTIINCTIASNIGRGVSGFKPTITNSIIFYNSVDSGGVQIESSAPPVVTFTDVQGGWTGEGNIGTEPCFAEPGYWNQNGTPENTNDDFWVPGDYHLRSQTGRWDPTSQSWVADALTSPCIDAGNPASDWAAEPAPNGGRINMGTYGGTSQASKSPQAS